MGSLFEFGTVGYLTCWLAFPHSWCWYLHVASWCSPSRRHVLGTSPAKNQEQPQPCHVQAHHSIEKEIKGLCLAAHRSCMNHRHGLPRFCYILNFWSQMSGRLQIEIYISSFSAIWNMPLCGASCPKQPIANWTGFLLPIMGSLQFGSLYTSVLCPGPLGFWVCDLCEGHHTQKQIIIDKLRGYSCCVPLTFRTTQG